MKITRFVTICPACGYRNDAQGTFDGDFTPSDGDYSVCMQCTYVGLYTVSDDGVFSVRRQTQDEEAEMSENADLMKTLDALRKIDHASRSPSVMPEPDKKQ
jgi:hypothetical protein